MMDWTDRHCRVFHRILAPNARLYTEMVHAQAVIHGDRERLLGFDACEHPVALQLGGSEAHELAQCAKLGEEYGYDEINLNIGCPSQRVQRGAFGACLMAEPRLVADCVKAMVDAVDVPVTVKHRIGIDKTESYAFVRDFVGTVAEAGCRVFIVHARNAWLKGLSPKENRTVPPLRYPDVYRLKQERPTLAIEINGGIRDLDATTQHLEHVDAVMIGRAAYDDPYLFAAADERFFADATPVPGRAEIAMRYGEYAARWLALHPRLKLSGLARHVLGLFSGQPGAREFRRILTTPGEGRADEIMARAVAAIDRALALRVRPELSSP